MVFWWTTEKTDQVDVETPRTERGRTNSVPGSPSIVFLKSPVVVERMLGEKTGLLPGRSQRPESLASKQIKRCQLVAVVFMSVLAAAVIILFLAGGTQGDDTRR
ncbi:unnamed protein product [Scytosiphon promiscuus]